MGGGGGELTPPPPHHVPLPPRRAALLQRELVWVQQAGEWESLASSMTLASPVMDTGERRCSAGVGGLSWCGVAGWVSGMHGHMAVAVWLSLESGSAGWEHMGVS